MSLHLTAMNFTASKQSTIILEPTVTITGQTQAY